MRFVGATIAALMLAACGTSPAQLDQAFKPTTCTVGYSSASPALHITDADSGKQLTAPLCGSVWITLAGPANGTVWQSIQSSDPAVLEILPLPLPHPPDGGIESVYLAKRTGSARLSAVSFDPTCPTGAFCPFLPAWTVTVNVATT